MILSFEKKTQQLLMILFALGLRSVIIKIVYNNFGLGAEENCCCYIILKYSFRDIIL